MKKLKRKPDESRRGGPLDRLAFLQARRKKTTVVNVRDSAYDVYIGRPSRWRNPFKIGQDGSRKEVIAKYREWLFEPKQRDLLVVLEELRGKRLGCYCAPEPCHGDVLIEVLTHPTKEEAHLIHKARRKYAAKE